MFKMQGTRNRKTVGAWFVVAHPSDKNKDAARVGHPILVDFIALMYGLKPVLFMD